MSLGKTKHLLQQIKTFPLYCREHVENALFSLVLFLHKHTFLGEKEKSRVFSCLAGNRHSSLKVGEKLSC